MAPQLTARLRRIVAFLVAEWTHSLNHGDAAVARYGRAKPRASPVGASKVATRDAYRQSISSAAGRAACRRPSPSASRADAAHHYGRLHERLLTSRRERQVGCVRGSTGGAVALTGSVDNPPQLVDCFGDAHAGDGRVGARPRSPATEMITARRVPPSRGTPRAGAAPHGRYSDAERSERDGADEESGSCVRADDRRLTGGGGSASPQSRDSDEPASENRFGDDDGGEAQLCTLRPQRPLSEALNPMSFYRSDARGERRAPSSSSSRSISGHRLPVFE